MGWRKRGKGVSMTLIRGINEREKKGGENVVERLSSQKEGREGKEESSGGFKGLILRRGRLQNRSS